MSKSKTFEINWFGAAGSALGAVSSAVVLSTLGAAGTLIGAAVGSLVITVGGSLYTQSLQKTKAHVDTRLKMGSSASTGPADSSSSAPRTGSTSATPPKPPRRPLGEVMRGLPWKRITLLAGALFVVAMVVIVAFELSTGRPVSSFTGGSSETRTGTTFDGLRPAADASAEAEDPEQPGEQQSPGPDATEDAEPTQEPTQDTPTEEPTQDTPAEEPTQDTPAEEPTQDKPAQENPPAAPAPAEPPAQQNTDE